VVHAWEAGIRLRIERKWNWNLMMVSNKQLYESSKDRSQWHFSRWK